MLKNTSNVLASKIYSKAELCLLEPKLESCSIVIFGASGDLTFRKLLPSLFYLASNSLMPKAFAIVGVARTPMSQQDFRERIRSAVSNGAHGDQVEDFVNRCFYLSGDYAAAETYASLKKTLEDLESRLQIGRRRILYLSTPSSVYTTAVQHLGRAGLNLPHGDVNEWVRVVIEKPFGSSLETAQQLNHELRKVLKERQIYRIDHYLGKETVQNILMFRFANILFEPVWNRNYIDHIQITAAEKIGVEHRAGYYEQAGILRDMFQNHLLQLLAVTAMEPPSSLEANTVRERRLDIIRSIRPLSAVEIEQNTVCGQYGSGEVDGEAVLGYRQEKSVNPASRVPTFAAIRFQIENWRWQGVPFYLRSGKRLGDREVEISVHFKQVPTSIFKPLLADQLAPNILKFRIQPDEGIQIQFEAKHPGPKLCMSTVTMDFSYRDTFRTPPPESYARLFQDAMMGDQTLFARSDEVEESWRVVDPIIKHWETDFQKPLPSYQAGSWGPPESQTLINKSGRTWDIGI